jgi:hypothetical protein
MAFLTGGGCPAMARGQMTVDLVGNVALEAADDLTLAHPSAVLPVT